MMRPLAGTLTGAAVLLQLAVAPAAAEENRYRLVPDALLPNQAGVLETQTVLFDTMTGQTWQLAPGDGARGHRWAPLEITFADRGQASAARKGSVSRRSNDWTVHKASRTGRLGEDYDSDP